MCTIMCVLNRGERDGNPTSMHNQYDTYVHFEKTKRNTSHVRLTFSVKQWTLSLNTQTRAQHLPDAASSTACINQRPPKSPKNSRVL